VSGGALSWAEEAPFDVDRRPITAARAPVVIVVMVVLENPTPDPLATGVGLVQDAAATTPLTVDTTGAVAPQHHQMSGGCLSATYPIPTTAAAGHRHQLKMVPKRFINMHQWFNPIGVKQIKEAMVRVRVSAGSVWFFFNPRKSSVFDPTLFLSRSCCVRRPDKTVSLVH